MDFVFSDVFSLFSIIQAAAAHKPLTPSERAWLKAYKGIVHAVLAAVLLGLYQFFSAHAQLAGINWQVELTGVGVLIFKAYLDARAKFFTAQAPAEIQTGQLLSSALQVGSVALPSILNTVAGLVPSVPATPAPTSAPVPPSAAAPSSAPVSGGAEMSAEPHLPTDPFLRPVPLPRSQRSAPNGNY